MMENPDLKRRDARLLFPSLMALVMGCSGVVDSGDPAGAGGSGNGAGGTLVNTGGSHATGGASGGAMSSGGQPSGGTSSGGTSTGGALASGGMTSGGATGTGGSFRDNYPQGANWTATSYRIGALCGNSICHNGLELFSLMEDDQLHDTLLSRTVEQCGDVPLVAPGDPENSALLMLTTRKCGDFVMPEGCGTDICLPDYWIPELSEWIRSGAKKESLH